ncbi:MAG: hypothetical protein LBC83_01595 [Oscillospiraceae bacterium]|nr:hypothetical protein [Oscillospiraceae bacterium]
MLTPGSEHRRARLGRAQAGVLYRQATAALRRPAKALPGRTDFPPATRA